MERQTFHQRRTRQGAPLFVHGRPKRGTTQPHHSRVRPAPHRARQTLQMRHRRRHAQTPHPSPIALEASPKCPCFLTQLLGSVTSVSLWFNKPLPCKSLALFSLKSTPISKPVTRTKRAA